MSLKDYRVKLIIKTNNSNKQEVIHTVANTETKAITVVCGWFNYIQEGTYKIIGVKQI